MLITIDSLHVAMTHFARREYWERLWIVEELGLRRRIVLARGSYRTALVDLPKLYVSISREHPLRLLEYGRNFHFETTTAGARSTLRQLMSTHKNAGCAGPWDRIYGLRALALDITKDAIMPDYSKSTADLYWDVLELCGCHEKDEMWLHLELLQVLGISIDDIRR